MTGRAAGFCAGNSAPGFANPTGGHRGGFFGRGRGRGCCGGSGRGHRNQFFATGLPGWARMGGAAASASDEKQALHAQADALEAQLNAVRKRMETLEKA